MPNGENGWNSDETKTTGQVKHARCRPQDRQRESGITVQRLRQTAVVRRTFKQFNPKSGFESPSKSECGNENTSAGAASEVQEDTTTFH
jgi:hypothetical protein